MKARIFLSLEVSFIVSVLVEEYDWSGPQVVIIHICLHYDKKPQVKQSSYPFLCDVRAVRNQADSDSQKWSAKVKLAHFSNTLVFTM